MPPKTMKINGGGHPKPNRLVECSILDKLNDTGKALGRFSIATQIFFSYVGAKMFFHA